MTQPQTAGPTLPPIRNTKEAIPKHAMILVYGGAKLGKTTAVVETTDNEKMIVATEDGETQGLQSVQDQDCDYVEVRDWVTFELVHAEMTKKQGECQYLGKRLDNVIVDSYSCCGHLWWDLALKQLGWKEVGLGRGRAGLQPYSYVAEKGRQATKRLMMIAEKHRANIIVVAREGIAESGMGTDDYKSIPCIELPGAKLYNELPGSFDAVVRFKRVNGQNVFVTTEEGGAIAGVRVPKSIVNSLPGGKLPLYIKPNVADLIKLVLGDKEALNRLKLTAPGQGAAPAVNRR